MAKGDAFDPGGVMVRCSFCLHTELIAFDLAPFVHWPPQCPICASRGRYQPMTAYRTKRKTKVAQP